MRILLFVVAVGLAFLIGMYIEKMEWIALKTETLVLLVLAFPLAVAVSGLVFVLLLLVKDRKKEEKRHESG